MGLTSPTERERAKNKSINEGIIHHGRKRNCSLVGERKERQLGRETGMCTAKRTQGSSLLNTRKRLKSGQLLQESPTDDTMSGKSFVMLE